MALAMAGATGGTAISPTPPGASLLGISSMRISGVVASVGRLSASNMRVRHAAGEAGRRAERGGDAPDDAAFDLLEDDIGVDDPPAIDRCEHAIDADLLRASTCASTSRATWLPKLEWAASP